MDIYKCPKSETQKNFPSKNFNILNNKLKKELKAEGYPWLKPIKKISFLFKFKIYIYTLINQHS